MKRESSGPILTTVFVDYDNVYLSLKRKNEEAAKRFSKDAGVWIKEIAAGTLMTPTNSPAMEVERRVAISRCYGNPGPRRNQSDNSPDMSSFPFVRHHFLRAGFEVVDCPPLTAQMKNSADIRMVVDALDLCYTKSHVDTFVIISGDSDFSPLVSKLRENNKRVIGVGVKAATSDLLAANCDEFIFYDDLVRELPAKKQRGERKAAAKPAASAAAKPKPEEKPEDRKRQEAIDLVVETVEALVTERGEDEKIWGSMVKQTLKRRKPGFSESYYGYRSFGELLEDAMKHKLLVLERDEKSGQHIIRLPAED